MLGVMALVLTSSSAALADAGIPMLVIVYPSMIVTLLPVVVLETVILRRRLGTALRRTAFVVMLSNLASTMVGIPLAWAALVGLEVATSGGVWPLLDTFAGKLLAVTWQAPWLFRHESDFYWQIPVATAVLLVPFFFVSWWVEYWLSRRLMRGVEPKRLRAAVAVANLVSYALLEALAMIWLVADIVQHAGT